MEALASAAVAERERTGSARLTAESLEERIAEMEVAKAVGSLRLGLCLERWVWLGFVGSEAEDWSESEDEAEVALSRDCLAGGRCFAAGVAEAASVFGSESASESARFTAGNSSSLSAEDEEGLE